MKMGSLGGSGDGTTTTGTGVISVKDAGITNAKMSTADSTFISQFPFMGTAYVTPAHIVVSPLTYPLFTVQSTLNPGDNAMFYGIPTYAYKIMEFSGIFNQGGSSGGWNAYIGLCNAPNMPNAEDDIFQIGSGALNQCASCTAGIPTATALAHDNTINHAFKINRVDNGHVLFYVDGSLVATHTTNIPTAVLNAIIGVYGSGAGQSCRISLNFPSVKVY
jgi:hypothetical protein